MNALIRSTVLLACILALSGSVRAQLNLSGSEPGEETVIEFEQTEYNMGEFVLGDTVHGVFKFKNVGKADLLIDNVKPSCQCTKLIFPDKPIKPGATGEILASIDTEGKVGEQSKWFMVFYNGNPPMERVTMNFTVKGDEVKEGENPEEKVDAPRPVPVPAKQNPPREPEEPEASLAPKPPIAPVAIQAPNPPVEPAAPQAPKAKAKAKKSKKRR